jgi:hypothetical protein
VASRLINLYHDRRFFALGNIISRRALKLGFDRMFRDEYGTLYLEYGPRNHYELPSYVISGLMDEQQTSDKIGSPSVSSWEIVPRNGYSIAIKAWADMAGYRKLETIYPQIFDPFLVAYVEQIRPPKPVSEIKSPNWSNWR